VKIVPHIKGRKLREYLLEACDKKSEEVTRSWRKVVKGVLNCTSGEILLVL
jgi:hypothetical protein